MCCSEGENDTSQINVQFDLFKNYYTIWITHNEFNITFPKHYFAVTGISQPTICNMYPIHKSYIPIFHTCKLLCEELQYIFHNVCGVY